MSRTPCLVDAESRVVAEPAILTGRRVDIARLVAQDLSNKQVAARLFLSERTVKTHVTNIMNKLGLNCRVRLGRRRRARLTHRWGRSAAAN